MHLIQFEGENGRAVAATEGGNTSIVTGATSVYGLASEAAERGLSLRAIVIEKGLGKAVDREALAREGRLLAPVDHPDLRIFMSPAPASPISAPPRPATPCTSRTSSRRKRR